MRGALLLSAVILLPAVGPAAAVERPEVAVRFALVDSIYQDELTDAQIAELDSGAAKLVLAKLSREIGFLRFSFSPDAPYTVTFRLGDPDARSLSDVDLHVELEGPEVSGAEDLLPFLDGSARDSAAEDFLASVQTFLRRIETDLEGRRFEELVPAVFSAIPLAAAEAHMLKLDIEEEPVAWIIPYKQEDWCMDYGSKVKVPAWVPVQNIGLRKIDFVTEAKQSYDPEQVSDLERFRFRLLCFPARRTGDADFTHLLDSDPEKVRVEAIHVTEYFRVDASCQPAIPTTEAFPTGGGS